jgi:hypothetical protein
MKEVGSNENKEKTNYMLMSRHQNAEENHDIKIVFLRKCGRVQILGNNSKESKFDSGKN